MAYNIQRYKATLVIDVSEDAAVIVSAPREFNGRLVGVIPTAPNLDDSDTYTVAIKDVDGNTIYSKASLAESVASPQFVDANNHPLRLPMSGNHTITITASGDQAADRTFTVVLLIDRG